MTSDRSRRSVLRVGAVTIGLTVAGCTQSDSGSPSPSSQTVSGTPSPSSQSPASDWPSRGRDPANSGYAPDEEGPRQAVSVDWESGAPGGAFSEPAVTDGTVYVGSNRTLHAFAAKDGSERWEFETAASVASTPAVADGTAYVLNSSDPALGEGIGLLRAVEDGTEEWQFETDGWTAGNSPAVVDGRVYVGVDGHAYALNAADGSQEWHTSLSDVREERYRPRPEAGASTPAVHDGTVYLGDQQVVALDAETGAAEWTAPTASRRGVTTDGEHVYAVRDSGVVAVDASDGSEAWSADLDVSFLSSPAVDDRRLYVGGRVPPDGGDSRSGLVIALATDDGSVEWRHSTAAAIQARPSVAADVVYVATGFPGSGAADNALLALNADDGSTVWSVETGKRVHSSPVVVDGDVYASAGTTRALR
ncbi:hypothetical protein BRD00_06415 [Halobacteriales archaeon QS_8_69_26]|nr:MAG: hypothetical protein BRD00_06415 [Halobacteriales archaeon QS_8_69_26]